MNLPFDISVIVLSVPLATALTSFFFVLTTFQDDKTLIEGRLRRMALAYYLASIVSTVGILIYPFSAEVFSWISPFHYLALLLTPILLYGLICLLTGTGHGKCLSWGHFVIPALIFVTLFTWSIFVPYQIRVDVAGERTGSIIGYEAFASFCRSRMEARMAYSIFYLMLMLLQISNYKREGKNASNHKEISQWVRVLASLSIATVIIPVAGLFKSTTIFSTALTIFAVVALAVFHLEFLFRLLSGRFPKTTPAFILSTPKTKEKVLIAKTKKLDKQSFEEWIKTEKPYRNPDFTIDMAVEALGVNRTYISQFVNDTYGVNFSRYLNRLRLKELKRLLRLQSNKEKSAVELYAKAGFGSYRSYLRAKSAEEKVVSKPRNKSDEK